MAENFSWRSGNASRRNPLDGTTSGTGSVRDGFRERFPTLENAIGGKPSSVAVRLAGGYSWLPNRGRRTCGDGRLVRSCRQPPPAAGPVRSELSCVGRSGPAEPSHGMSKRPEPPPEQELPVPRRCITKKPLLGPSRPRGVEQGRAAGQSESLGFSIRVWPDALLRLPAGEGSRLDSGLGRRGRLRSILSLPRFSGLTGRGNPSRGRVAEWLKAPDSKSGVLARVPGVQIPPLPPFLYPDFIGVFTLFQIRVPLQTSRNRCHQVTRW